MRPGLARRLGGAATVLVAAAAAAAAPPPAEQFTRQPAMSDLKLSPSGKRLAMVLTLDSGNRAAAVLDLPLQGAPRIVAGLGDSNVSGVFWVNDERLVVQAFEIGARASENGGIAAVDQDGGNLRPLMDWRSVGSSTGTRLATRMLPYGWYLGAMLDDGSADILVYERLTDAMNDTVGYKLGRLNTQTAFLQILSHGMPLAASSWQLDAKGELRVAREVRNGRDRLLLREPDGTRWTALADVEVNSYRGLQPLYIEGDGQLIVSGYGGGNTVALYSFDLDKRKLDPEPLVRLERYDVDGPETDDKERRAVGVHVVTDQPRSVWFSDRLAGIQKVVDDALPPGRFNRIICGRCESSPFYLVLSQSDRQPGEYHLYDHAKRQLTRIGARRPWIDEAAQGRRSFHWITARDGLPLPVAVTHPAGKGDKEALPAVLLVHGGPWVRGADRRWDAEAQFLASRGYRVIEPDFRGSTGYGWKHFRAGWKEWGRAMQDDLADAVAWAAEQGLIDRERVCIYGGSYGGYAALMGPIKHPGVYRCAASFAGVTDIQLMFSSARSDMSYQSRRFRMPEMVGDPQADAERLRAASPIERVAEIKVPVLLVQGTLDVRVPREHANKFESAARAAGVKIERVDYGDEGHGWSSTANHADFLRRLEGFLERSLRR